MTRDEFNKVSFYWIKERANNRREKKSHGRSRKFLAFLNFGRPWLIDQHKK